jgi:hypothetical protein
VAYCSATVDVCLFVCTIDEKWIQEQKKTYEEVMVDMRTEIALIRMYINMDCGCKIVVITQPIHVKRVIETFK